MCGPNWRKQNLLRGRLHFIDRGIRGIGGIGTGGTFSVIDFRSREFFSSAFTSPSVNPPIRHQQIHHRLTSLSHGFPAFRGAKVQGYIFVRAFGNITKSGSPFTFTPSYSSATNRMTPIGSFTPTHDNNGNVLNDNSHAYTWNAGGQALTIDSVNLTYDALGRMVEQNRSGAYTQFVYAPTGQKMQIMNGQASTKSIVPLPGGGQAVFTASGQYYYHSDHLGSFRFASTSNRTMYFDMAYAPFGETYAASGSTDPAFTTQRQDTVAGLYDFPAREYSIPGRWPSPDPAGLAAVDPTNPQSWNRYAYVMNNPMAMVDPSGMGGQSPDCTKAADPYMCGYSYYGGYNGAGYFSNTWTSIDFAAFPVTQQVYTGSQLVGFSGGTTVLGGCDPSADCSNQEFPTYATVTTYQSIPIFSYPSIPMFSVGGNSGNQSSGAEFRAEQQWQQMQACVDNFHNTKAGKVIQFGSLYSFADDFVNAGENWTEALIVKGVILATFFKGANSAAGGVSPVTATLKPLVGRSGTVGILAATAADGLARGSC